MFTQQVLLLATRREKAHHFRIEGPGSTYAHSVVEQNKPVVSETTGSFTLESNERYGIIRGPTALLPADTPTALLA